MKHRLTQAEIVGNVLIFMGAGHETVATALQFATYELAKNADVLEKLQAEIDQLPLLVDENDNDESKKFPDYDTVTQMPYMNLFVLEVLRMYPIGNIVLHRQATEDTVVQGIKIEKGNCIVLD